MSQGWRTSQNRDEQTKGDKAMQAQYRIHQVSPRLVLWALAVTLLVVLAAAGGYAIRLATTSTAATPTTTVATQGTASGANSGTQDACIYVQDHKAC